MDVKPITVNTIATHIGCHFDEVLSIFLLWNFPHRNFVGADKASIEFHNAGRKTHDGKYATDEWMREHRMLYVGCGGSRFDEHPLPEQSLEDDSQGEKECAASLVAQALGIDQYPELQSILNFARRVDATATADPRDLSSVIKKFHDNWETNKRTVTNWVKDPVTLARMMELMDRRVDLDHLFKWVEQGIYAKYSESPQTDDFTIDKIGELLREQPLNEEDLYTPEEWLQVGNEALELDDLLFKNVTAEEYRNFKTIVPFRGKGRRGEIVDLKLACVASDDVRIHRFARSKLGDQVAVTVQRRRNGQVVVMTNKYYNIDLKDVVRAIKTEEAEIRGLELPRWDEMKRQLQHSVWYYHRPGQNLFNGAKTSPDTEPTRIPLARIMTLVKMGLSVEMFHPSRFETCAQDICTSTRSQPCQWYKYGFSRCQKMRWEAHRDDEAEASQGK